MPAADQFDLFGKPQSSLPEGLRYAGEVISAAEADRLVEAFADLPFRPFDFHGFKGNRRVVSFGWRYDFSAATLKDAQPMPAFLETARRAAADFAGVAPAACFSLVRT